jgi:hypothetical protein
MTRGKRSESSTSFRLNPTGSGSDALRNGAASGDGFGRAGRGALTVTHAAHKPGSSPSANADTGPMNRACLAASR